MELEDYITEHSDAEPEHLAVINRTTHLRMINPRMLSGHFQGRVLAMLSHMIRPRRILEIGTFTGYSALCLAEGLTDDGILHTIEIDDELEKLLLENFSTSAAGQKIKLHIGNALEVIREINEVFDLVFIDAEKSEYKACYEMVLPKVRTGGFILVDNTLWDGKVLSSIQPKDKDTPVIKEFNDFIRDDHRVEKVLLPIRDGLTVIRKK